MTPEQQNREIFESQGWVYVPPVPRTNSFIVAHENLRRWKKGRKYAYLDEIPDYTRDLNAMHEAEKAAPPDYWVKLAQMCGLNGQSSYDDLNNTFWPSIQGKMIGKIAGATAAQRAEAYLKTLNLWTE
jgi:hypothetical protein